MSLTDVRAPYSLYFWLEEFEEEGDWPAVLRTAKELLHLAPDNPEGLRYLAEAYFQAGRSEEAYSTALKLTRVSPMTIDGWWILSDLAAQAEDYERSVDYIEKAARLIPNSDAIWVEVAKANFNLGRLPQCLVAADHGLRVNPCNIRLLIFKVFCLAGLKSRQGARIAASRLVSLGVDSEVLRDTAKELGLSGSALGRVMSLANTVEGGGALPEVSLPAQRPGRRRGGAAVTSGLQLLSRVAEQAAPLTPRQFALQLDAAARRRADDEAGEDLAPTLAEDEVDPESDPLTAATVYYVYDRFRTHGPYTAAQVRSFVADGTFALREAFVRVEGSEQWEPIAGRFGVVDGAGEGT
jgi:tetratricopeptide (TPR) repeat protein